MHHKDMMFFIGFYLYIMLGLRMQVEIAKINFCQSARYTHAEINRALHKDLTIEEFLRDEHLPNHNFRPEFTKQQLTSKNREEHDICHISLMLAYKKMGVDTTDFRFWYNGNEIAESMVIPIEMRF